MYRSFVFKVRKEMKKLSLSSIWSDDRTTPLLTRPSPMLAPLRHDCAPLPQRCLPPVLLFLEFVLYSLLAPFAVPMSCTRQPPHQANTLLLARELCYANGPYENKHTPLLDWHAPQPGFGRAPSNNRQAALLCGTRLHRWQAPIPKPTCISFGMARAPLDLARALPAEVHSRTLPRMGSMCGGTSTAVLR